MLDKYDADLVLLLAGGGGCSLDSSPGKNWVERSGGLPGYICRIAKAVMRSGKSKSSAIAIAVSRVKKWAAGGDDVDADTRAKAAAAVAQWEALKTKNKAKKVIKASHDGSDYIFLSSVGAFNTDVVRGAWDAQERLRRHAYEKEHEGSDELDRPSSGMYPYRWIRELWSDSIIVESEGAGEPLYLRIPYSVSGSIVTFGEATMVEKTWIPVTGEAVDLDDLTEIERGLLGDVLELTASRKSYLEVVQAIVQKG